MCWVDLNYYHLIIDLFIAFGSFQDDLKKLSLVSGDIRDEDVQKLINRLCEAYDELRKPTSE